MLHIPYVIQSGKKIRYKRLGQFNSIGNYDKKLWRIDNKFIIIYIEERYIVKSAD